MCGIHNSVLVAVMVHCRAGMGLRLHHWMAGSGLEFPDNWSITNGETNLKSISCLICR